MAHVRHTLLGVLTLTLLAGPALAADGPPKLDVEATCRSATRAQASTTDTATVDGCLRSERAALKEAQGRWGDYTPAAKSQCERQFQAGGYPSYVEMVTCLELASGTVPTQPGGGGLEHPKEKASGNLTPEASPAQRTDPLEVLDKTKP